MKKLKSANDSGVLVVLANEMDNLGTLNEESCGRADLASKLFVQSNFVQMITCGWDYRDDSDLPISHALTNYITSSFNINKDQIHDEIRSRDTVGDAVFTRDYLEREGMPAHLVVVTSDYHVERTKHIFEYVFSGVCKIVVIGANTPESESHTDAEEQSILAFHRTFDGVKPGDFKSIVHTLLTKHPYYNGEVHPIFIN